MKAIQSKWFKPYTKKGNNLRPSLGLPSKKFQSGVYLIKNIHSGKIIYVGRSLTNLYKTIYRHFQQWNDYRYGQRIDRIVYDKTGYQIRIIFVSPSQVPRLEAYLINKYLPRDNGITYKDAALDKQIDNTKDLYNGIVMVNPGEDSPF